MNFLLAEEIGTAGWIAIIAAVAGSITTVLTTVLQMIFSYMREARRMEREYELKQDVNQVKVATDGMTTKLAEASEAAGHARGGMEERARADARDVVAAHGQPLAVPMEQKPLPVAIVSVPDQKDDK